jgi:hypothetical protein
LVFGRKFSKSFQAAQPRWSRVMFWIVGLPAFLTWCAVVVVGMNGDGIPMCAALTAFGIMFVILVIQWVCYFIYGPAY